MTLRARCGMLLSFKCGECAYQRSETFVSAAASKRQSPVLRVHRARARTRTGQAVCGPTSVSAASFGCRDKSRQGRRQRRRVIHPLAQTAGGRSPAQISRRPPASAAGAPDLRSHRPFLRPGPARPGRFGCWRPLRLDTRDSRATSNHSRLESDQQSLESDQQSATSDQRSLTRERSAISDQRPAVALTLERPAISDQQSLETRKRPAIAAHAATSGPAATPGRRFAASRVLGGAPRRTVCRSTAHGHGARSRCGHAAALATLRRTVTLRRCGGAGIVLPAQRGSSARSRPPCPHACLGSVCGKTGLGPRPRRRWRWHTEAAAAAAAADRPQCSGASLIPVRDRASRPGRTVPPRPCRATARLDCGSACGGPRPTFRVVPAQAAHSPAGPSSGPDSRADLRGSARLASRRATT